MCWSTPLPAFLPWHMSGSSGVDITPVMLWSGSVSPAAITAFCQGLQALLHEQPTARDTAGRFVLVARAAAVQDTSTYCASQAQPRAPELLQ